MNKKPQSLTKEQLPAAFKAIQIGITEEDRLSAALDLGISYITVLRYLRGEIGKEWLGNALLNFLTERQKQPA